MGPPSDKQKQTLEKLGIMPDQIENAGKAAKILDRLDKRRNEGLLPRSRSASWRAGDLNMWGPGSLTQPRI
ncbi:MAG: hypothetical protein ACLUTU_00545 [Blautia faecis]